MGVKGRNKSSALKLVQWHNHTSTTRMLWSHEERVERSWAGASNGGKRGSMGMRGLMCQGAVDVVSSPFSLFLHCFSLSYCLLLHHTQEHRTCLHSLPCLAPCSGGWEQERSWDQGLFLLQGRSKTNKSRRRAGARGFLVLVLLRVWELLFAGEPHTPLAGQGRGPEGCSR